MPMRWRIVTGSILRRVDVGAVEQHPSGDARARRQIVHAIQGANERRFSAARRSDQRGDAILAHVERHVVERVKGARTKRRRARALSLTLRETTAGSGSDTCMGRVLSSRLAPYASRLMRMIGRRIVKVVPRPRVDSAEIAPPCASTMPLTIANPSPAPPLSRRRDRSTT